MNRTVLVIEDEPDLFLVVRLTLGVAGFRVVGASTGEEALERLQVDVPDVILLDLMLPGIDGWAVIDGLRALGHFPGVPVVVTSAHASSSAEQHALEIGCAAYLTKPYSPEVLREMVVDIVGGEGER
jgi:CheY-like chemotaxis protein